VAQEGGGEAPRDRQEVGDLRRDLVLAPAQVVLGHEIVALFGRLGVFVAVIAVAAVLAVGLVDVVLVCAIDVVVVVVATVVVLLAHPCHGGTACRELWKRILPRARELRRILEARGFRVSLYRSNSFSGLISFPFGGVRALLLSKIN
jgi:hypothetical protein